MTSIKVHNPLPAAVLVLGLASGPAVAGDSWQIQQSGTVGCVLQSDAEQIVYLPPTRDLRSLFHELVMSGRCFILAGGTEVVTAPNVTEEDIVAVRWPADSTFLFVDRLAVQGPDGETPE